MHNLDYFPEDCVAFRYDLKFSEVNRKHLDTIADLQIIHEHLMNQDTNYRDIVNINNNNNLNGTEIEVENNSESMRFKEYSF
jgi:hypothetical protein